MSDYTSAKFISSKNLIRDMENLQEENEKLRKKVREQDQEIASLYLLLSLSNCHMKRNKVNHAK